MRSGACSYPMGKSGPSGVRSHRRASWLGPGASPQNCLLQGPPNLKAWGPWLPGPTFSPPSPRFTSSPKVLSTLSHISLHFTLWPEGIAQDPLQETVSKAGSPFLQDTSTQYLQTLDIGRKESLPTFKGPHDPSQHSH